MFQLHDEQVPPASCSSMAAPSVAPVTASHSGPCQSIQETRLEQEKFVQACAWFSKDFLDQIISHVPMTSRKGLKEFFCVCDASVWSDCAANRKPATQPSVRSCNLDHDCRWKAPFGRSHAGTLRSPTGVKRRLAVSSSISSSRRAKSRVAGMARYVNQDHVKRCRADAESRNETASLIFG